MIASTKKFGNLALVALCTAAMLAACSSDNGGGTDSTASETQSSNQTEGNSNSSSQTGENPESPDLEPYNLTLALPIFGAVPPDLEAVEAEMNKITQAEINTTIDILPISIGAWQQQMNLMTSSGEKLDLLFEFGSGYPHDAAAGKIMPMDEVLEKHGQGIMEAVGEKFMKAAAIDGKIYGVPVYTAYGTQSVIYMRKDLVEKYQIDITSIQSIEDLGPVFETIKANEPGIIPLASGRSTPLNFYRNYDRLGDSIGVLPGFDNGLKVENLYELEDYKKNVELMRQWFKAGYINKDAATTQTTVQQMVKADKAFSYFWADKPGQMAGETLATGKELVVVNLLPEIYTTTNDVLIGLWSIAAQSENPERAMMMLNLLYTNEKLTNLFVWGIEGKHYVKVSETQIDFPEGVDSSTVGYRITDWLGGNKTLMYVFKTDAADLRKQERAFNDSIKPSRAFGFAFNAQPVKNEITAINTVIEQYRQGLETGTVDPSNKLDEFNKKLKAAGLDKVIAEKQRQLDEWAASNK